MKKSLLVLSMVLAIAACKSDSADDAALDSSGEYGGDYATSGVAVSLPDPIPGITPGTSEDFAARASTRVFFDLNQSDLKPAARDTLRLQALWFKAYPDVNATIEGHCDERGTREYNQALGERRASRVKQFLAAQGLSPSRFAVISYGKERPEFPEATESAYSKNRRGITVIK